MTKDQLFTQIEKEFAMAAAAKRSGNEGMVRVCARRAAGLAISYWLRSHPGTTWGTDVMSQLRNLQTDSSMPDNVRVAAMRLTTKVSQRFTSPFSTDPIADSNCIIQYLLD